MTNSRQERIDPETGQKLVRSERCLTISYKGKQKKIKMPGWYSPEDTTGESGLHDFNPSLTLIAQNPTFFA